MTQNKDQLLQRMRDNVNKVMSDMVTLALDDFQTTGKGLIVEESPVVTPELVVDLFDQHVKRIFHPDYELPSMSSLAIFRLLKYDPQFELLYWDKPASSIYVKKNA